MALGSDTRLPLLFVERSLTDSTRRLFDALERFASGSRLNAAADDAAGLAIADRLRRDVRVAGRALQNATDGVSIVHVADHALGQVSNVLGRLAELASQAASGTLTVAQRSAVQAEFGSLVAEIDRQAQTTSFNGVQLLSAGATIALEVGVEATADSRITFTTVDGSASALGVSGLAVSTPAAAQAALGALASAVTTVSQERGQLGAVESRLRTAIANLRTGAVEAAGAEGRIRDADFATEAAAGIRAAILRHAAVALLAQANQAASTVLHLLR